MKYVESYLSLADNARKSITLIAIQSVELCRIVGRVQYVFAVRGSVNQSMERETFGKPDSKFQALDFCTPSRTTRIYKYVLMDWRGLLT